MGFRLLDIKGNRYLNARYAKFGVTYTAGLISKSFASGTFGLKSDTGTTRKEIGTKSPKTRRLRVTNKEEKSVTSTETVGSGATASIRTTYSTKSSQRTPNTRLRDYIVSINVVTISREVIPISRSLKEVRQSRHSKQWEEALQIEYQELVANNMWEIVLLSKVRNV
ncbi:hypothetical protein PHMEG_00021187 [Phytophthora megakarya]|uniref:Uncharacterized protein n=1 Tax=Phytophthora megakarya TaxID=4795 RepID=A0A225VMG8_9STRA|nr:hypothetical protein PHMEG_00021187 [Phytophthora megakarya]